MSKAQAGKAAWAFQNTPKAGLAAKAKGSLAAKAAETNVYAAGFETKIGDTGSAASGLGHKGSVFKPYALFPGTTKHCLQRLTANRGF